MSRRTKTGVCPKCQELFERVSACPRCGDPVVATRAALEGWERARRVAWVEASRQEGLVDEATAARLLRAARGEPPVPPAAALASPGGAPLTAQKDAAGPPPARSPAKQGVEQALERGADAALASAATFSAEVTARFSAMLASLDSASGEARPAEPEPPPPSSARRLAATEAARGVVGGSAVVGAGLEALDELDRPEHAPRGGQPDEARPLGALQAFWFIGALLVLAGSLMGVREAWRTFEGALKPLSIAGALFGYHVAFVLLSHVLARRSLVTGRVLGVIAIGLLPVSAVAVAVGLGMSPALASPAAALVVAGGAATLWFLGRRVFEGAGLALMAGLLPALALELPLAPSGPATELRVGLAASALVPPLLAATWARTAPREGAVRALALAAASLYGAMAVGVLAWFGGPNDEALRTVVPLVGLALPAWLGGAVLSVWWSVSAPGRGLAATLGEAAGPIAVVAVAALLGASLGGAAASFARPVAGVASAGPMVFAPALVLVVASAVSLFEPRARRFGVHVAVPLAHLGVFVAARAAYPSSPVAWWLAACGVVPIALLVASSFAVGPGRRLAIPIWAVLEGLSVVAGTFLGELSADPAPGAPFRTTAAVAVALAVAAHAGARTAPAGRPWLHLFGGVATFLASAALLLPPRPEPAPVVVVWLLAAVAAAYGAAGLVYGLVSGDPDDRPLDDVSLAALAIGLVVSVAAVRAPSAGWAQAGLATTPAELDQNLGRAGPVLALAALLALRALRDASAVVSLAAGLAIALGAFVASGGQTLAEGALVASGVAGLLLAPASLRAAEPSGAPPFGRAVLGLLPLPLGARGRGVLDGYGLAGALLALLAYACGAAWIAARGGGPDTLEPVFLRVEGGRGLVVVAVGMALLFWLGAFSTRALERVSGRGRVVTLALAGVGVAIAAVCNRIGHPLPPEVVGFRLTLILAGVWLVARLFVYGGPRVGEWLEQPEQGAHYHFVPHVGVFALAALLLFDVWAVGGPTPTRALFVTPPLFFFGAGLGALLLFRSSGAEPFLHVGLASWVGFAATAAAQRAVLGPLLAPLEPPGGRWVPVATLERARGGWLDPTRFLPAGLDEYLVQHRALAGVGAFTLAAAALFTITARLPIARRAVGRWLLGRPEAEHAAIGERLAAWTSAAACLHALLALVQPSLVGAALVTAAGALVLAAPGPWHRGVALALGAPLVVHALAHLPVEQGAAALVADWPGPVLAALATVPPAAAWLLRSRFASATLTAAPVTLAYSALALVYAFATFAPMRRAAALPALLGPVPPLPAGTAFASFSLAATLGLLAVAAALSAWSFRGALASIGSSLPPVVGSLAGVALATTVVFTTPDAVFAGLLTSNGALVGACVAGAAALGHLAVLGLRARGRSDATPGAELGRDVALFGASVVLAVFVVSRAPGGFHVAQAGLVAFGVAFVVALHAGTTERTARHVVLVEGLVLALYSFATDELPLRPEVHALLGLAYGFTLLGVAVVARRRGIPTVARGTRVVLATLPVVIGLFMPAVATSPAALIALGGGALYGAVGLAEGSRLFGSLAAVAGNLALLVFALAQGLDGVEVYVGPLGILVAMLSQVFAPKLSKGARSSLRVLGGALLYLPSGLRLVTELGSSPDATYSVLFGVLCLVGVIAGLVLHVRAYLALGTLFLTLDVVINLVFIGLRDHRIGFVLLSASGLGILAIMIAVTLRREAARGLLEGLRARLRSWD